MYWKNFSKIVATFALLGPLAGTAPIWLLFFLAAPEIARRTPLMVPVFGLTFGFPFALLTGVIFAVLALSRGHRHLADAWLSTLVADLCVVAAYCATLDVGRMGIIGAAAMWIEFAIPSLAAATICWLVVDRWCETRPIVISPERADR
ncbi:hypothetical protein FM996_17465 [Methylosinus sporium]|uniref:Uncharacterized protein n=1 Tax=Methylosinus sporium TaxID=428 RepID=A0A549SL54_METSR|nr:MULTISPECIES: hypothetical protein [Methylosinus]MBU3890538.1 hypothetical protein [Methylosinus sp. KRF6]TRL30360.1 hypothetical protein FM996_17465 [Methylosinus sporium]